jgi:demethylmenaquinone methyltransferase/2-methoxy-6-polyprenyl-1,4-benzoquinol methylase
VLDHFNLLAPFYERFIPPPDTSQLFEILNLPTKGRLLDAGGGTGRVSSQFGAAVGKIVLTDVSEGMLKQAQIKGNLIPSLAHAERMPFADETFDRVLVVDALHHFSNQQEAIADMARVLKPGGRLVIEEPDLNHMRVKLVALAEKLALMRSHFYAPIEISRMVAQHGLKPHIVYDDKITAWVVGDK